jgi:hypothetical protein
MKEKEPFSWLGLGWRELAFMLSALVIAIIVACAISPASTNTKK